MLLVLLLIGLKLARDLLNVVAIGVMTINATLPLLSEERCVTSQKTAAKETRQSFENCSKNETFISYLPFPVCIYALLEFLVSDTELAISGVFYL